MHHFRREIVSSGAYFKNSLIIFLSQKFHTLGVRHRFPALGDAEVFIRTATYNADVAAFFTKWLVDVDDGQTPAGSFSDVSPNTMNCDSVPAWGDAGVICPWTIYEVYGDKRILEEHLPAMTKWVEYLRVESTDLIRDKKRGNDYGDWLSIGANTPKDLIGTAFFAYSTHLLAKSCRAVGRVEAAAKYEQLFNEIKTAFNKRYVAEDGRIKGNTQCVYAMALKFELLPENLRPKAAQYLEEDIKAKGTHLSTGFVGVSYLLPVVTQMGMADTAYSLLLQDTFPSWLFSVKHGATTIWERWNGWTHADGFFNPHMNSFNHYSLGSVGEWLFRHVAGIELDPDAAGFQRFVLHPYPGAGLDFARASFRTMHGEIESHWQLSGDHVVWSVRIPANTSATVFVPSDPETPVTENARPVEKAAGLRVLRRDGRTLVCEAGAGSYVFQSTWHEPAHP